MPTTQRTLTADDIALLVKIMGADRFSEIAENFADRIAHNTLTDEQAHAMDAALDLRNDPMQHLLDQDGRIRADVPLAELVAHAEQAAIR